MGTVGPAKASPWGAVVARPAPAVGEASVALGCDGMASTGSSMLCGGFGGGTVTSDACGATSDAVAAGALPIAEAPASCGTSQADPACAGAATSDATLAAAFD